MVEKMESVPCGAKEKGVTGLGNGMDNPPASLT